MFKYLKIFILLFTTFGFAQTKVEIKGVVKDQTNVPLEAVTVFINKASDGSLIEYSITNQKGEFTFSVKNSSEDFFLKASLVGMVDFTQTIKLDKSQNFPEIVLKDDSSILGELVIVTEAPPVRVKTDTLEFNAASFKVMPDANVEALLKQLPGVVVDADGKITVNGKEANQILVNGKPFFDKDGKMALQNLPADLIQKVQVSDYKTKMEEFTKQQSSSDNVSINLTIDEKKNKGYFGKATAGYGTDDRYEAGINANYFQGKTKFSLIASSNNINSNGVAMDEVFDNMSSSRASGAGSNRSGITTTHTVGFNYDDEWFKNFDTNASYNFNQTNNENRNRSRRVNLLADGNFISNSESKSNAINRNHNFNAAFEYKISEKLKLYYAPSVTFGNRDNVNNSIQNSTEEDGTLLNESTSNSRTENTNKTISNNLLLVKTFDKKGRRISLDATTSNGSTENETRLNSETFFYNTNTNDLRNQLQNNRTTTDSYSFTGTYAEPITDSLKVEIGLTYNNNKNSEGQNTFDFDNLSGSFTNRNEYLSNYVNSNISEFLPTTGIIIDKSKHRFKITGGSKISNLNAMSDYLSTITRLDRNYFLPVANFNYNYKPNRSKSLRARYSYNTTLPSARQILPFEDLSNPLNTYFGNPDIDVTRTHNASLGYVYNNQTTKNNFNIFGSFRYNDKSIISVTNFDENRKRYTTYENVEGTYNGTINFGWYKTQKIENQNISYGINLNPGYSLNKGYVNNTYYDARTFSVGPRVFFNYELSEYLKLSPSYTFSYNLTNYENYYLKSATNNIHRFNLQTTSYWPKNVIWGNDFGYTYNSNIAQGFKKDFYMWNTSLAYYFLDKTFLAKVKVYDLLNQNLGNTRTVSETAITDQENLVLKRYVMFSITYKLDKFGGKSQQNNDSTKGERPADERGPRPDGGSGRPTRTRN